MNAIAGEDVARVSAMLRPGASLNPAHGTTPLYRAAVGGCPEIVRMLIEYGADPDQPSHAAGEGLPLCAAACWDHAQTVRALLDGGADPDAREDGGWTALLWAAALGNLESADELLDFGADPDLANDEGDTPLTLGARFGAYGVVWSLLEHGADPYLRGTGGASALEIARRWAGADLEAALREEVAAQLDDGVVLVSRGRARDGTRLVTVEGHDRDGGFAAARQCGHAAVVTVLEIATGVRPPAEELIARVLPYRNVDEDDETWWAAVHALQRRHDDEALAAAARLSGSDDPVDREFGVDVLAGFGRDPWHAPWHERSLAILRETAVHEDDPRVLEALLRALAHHADERALPQVLRIVRRPGREPGVNDAMALAAVVPAGDEDGLAALVRLTRHPDGEVRDWATMGLASLPADTPEVREALAARLADRDLDTVAEAARGLGTRHDRRAVAGIHRVLCESGDGDDYARELAAEAAQDLGIELGTDT
ncbi:ankyrin repeat domain-containing protein [Microbispora sp. RL4-1S]|uniref:Ankyrin repeat domain-containing protein n=2 Tax=Microbispora oryzae TaxID=2806554 RepID=A0A940WQH8_9ACTN|nr:ankyrin repeat domain-containing protein [Microbispora oryzae]